MGRQHIIYRCFMSVFILATIAGVKCAPTEASQIQANHKALSDALSEGDDEMSEYDDDVYSLTHLWYAMEDLMQEQVDTLNNTFDRKISNGEERISALKSELDEKEIRLNKLEESIEELKKKRKREEPPTVGDVKLYDPVDMPGNMVRGFLLVYTGEKLGWGTVCDDNFGSSESKVACKQLGYRDGFAGRPNSYKRSSFGNYSIVMDELSCDDSSLERITDCQHQPFGTHNCNINESVFLFCLRLF